MSNVTRDAAEDGLETEPSSCPWATWQLTMRYVLTRLAWAATACAWAYMAVRR